MAVREISVEGGGAGELEFGPFFIDLSGGALAAGTVSWAFDAPVPAGTYEEVEIKVNTVPLEKAGGNTGLAAMAKAGASIIVDGVMDPGTPGAKDFSFRTPMEIEQKREGTIVIGGEKPANVTLDFDPRGWFTAPGGGRLDPSDPTNQARSRRTSARRSGS